MDYQEKLLEKYFKGETSLEEEKELQKQLAGNSEWEAEHDMFGFFKAESEGPGDLEQSLLAGLEKHQNAGGRSRRMRWYSIASAAAVVVLLLSVYIDFRHTRKTKLENDFLVMEHALFQVSQSLQPEEQKDMMVLWVDDDVEIIIN